MGEHDVAAGTSAQEKRAFTRALLNDVQALERMLEAGMFEAGVRRIGAEQELFLVDSGMGPAPLAPAMLERLADHPEFTNELARFNLEANLEPRELGGRCLHEIQVELERALATARRTAADLNGDIVMTGILPTITKAHLGLENMSPHPRYFELNRVLRQMRGTEFTTAIKGIDELETRHDNVMLEACNTSFQIHFQVAPDEFASLYNLAQLVTAPVLAVSVNSALLLGSRLWHETRVALFQQSLDTRHAAQQERGARARVHFGNSWVESSVVELIREDIAKYRSILAREVKEDPLLALDEGRVPRLDAWRLFNGTVYRWNRPCYGITKLPDGTEQPHLRIENRVLPAGPTVRDEVANAAFFFGLMSALGDEIGSLAEAMPFDDARDNFLAAARYGLKAQFRWFDGEVLQAAELGRRLLPIAERGLRSHGVDADDVGASLELLEQRISSGRTGAQWALDSISAMGDEPSQRDARQRALVAATIERQLSGAAVHEWPLAALEEAPDWRDSYRTVGQVMTTDLFTVHPEDVVDLAASLMEWEHIRHVPVEDDAGKLVGLVSHRALLRMVGRGLGATEGGVAVQEVMRPDPLTVAPETSTLEAIQMMRDNRLACLPVTRAGRLVGLVTEHDFMDVARGLLEDQLRGA